MHGCLRSFPAAGDWTVTPLDLTAAEGRRLILDLQGLADPPHRRFGGDGPLGLITRMGFVQVDSIRTVERAHHTILHSRNRTYRPAMLDRLLERDRSLFEHWTHDASVIPTAFYPVWRHKFRREAAILRAKYRRWHGPDFEAETGPLRDLIGKNGPVRARDLEIRPARNPRGWWDWHAGKTALEFLWRTGELAINAAREFPEGLRPQPTRAAALGVRRRAGRDRLHRLGLPLRLDRLGFGTAGEIAGYWALVATGEADAWAKTRLGADVIQAKVHAAERDTRPRTLYARADLEARLAMAAAPPAGLRVLSPFDPLIRDRKRLRHLFGFDYRIEIFVAEAQRQYGYYIFPLLEGDRTVGRIDMTANRTAGILNVRKLWLEPGIRFGAGRRQMLDGALERISRFADCRKWRMRMIGFRTFDVAGISTGGARPESGHAR